MATQISCIWKFVEFWCFLLMATHTINVHQNINKLSDIKNNMTYVIQINVKYVFQKNYQARKRFKDILYIHGGWNRERIALTDDLQLPSNHNQSSTRIIIQGQNIDDIWYVKKIIKFVVYNTKLKCYEVGLSYFWLTLVCLETLALSVTIQHRATIGPPAKRHWYGW